MRIFRVIISGERVVLHPAHCSKIVQKSMTHNIIEGQLYILPEEKRRVDIKSVLGLVSLAPKEYPRVGIDLVVGDNVEVDYIKKIVNSLEIGEIETIESIYLK